MATSAGRAQLITAARIWHDGQAHPGWGIGVDAQGRIAHIGPTEPDVRGALHFDGKILVPALVDALAPGALSASEQTPDYALHPAESPPMPLVLGYPALQASPSVLYARLRAALLARLRLGITCVGVPHVLARAPLTQAGSSPYPLADLMVAAAQDVGMRLAVCAGPDSQAPLQKGLDALCDNLRGLVGHLVSFADLRISWALLIYAAHALPIDALVALKLRMAHLPLLLVAEPLEPKGASAAAGARLRALLGGWAEHGVLDATTSVVLARQPPPSCAGLLASVGSPYVAMQGLPSPRSRAAGETGQGALSFGLRAEPAVPPQPPVAALAAWQRAAGVALGLRTPGWARGRWADFLTLPWPQGPRLDAGRPAAGDFGVQDVLVAGELVLRNGRHRFDDPPAPR